MLTEGTGVGEISTAELANITAGSVYEEVVSYIMESGGTSSLELIATLRTLYAQKETEVIARLQAQLRYYGHTESSS